MKDPASYTFDCTGPDDILRHVNPFADSFPEELRLQILDIYLEYMMRGGSERLYDRFNNRTALEIVAEWEAFKKSDEFDTPKVAFEGEIDGMHVTLFEPPDGNDVKSAHDRTD